MIRRGECCLRLLPVLLLASIALAQPAEHSGHSANYCYSCQRDSHGRIKRSSTVRRTFLRQQGLSGTPKDCQVDHIVPLAKGGSDTVGNLQLLCGPALKAKEAEELH